MKKILIMLVALFIYSNNAYSVDFENQYQDTISVEAQKTFVQQISALKILDGLLTHIAQETSQAYLVLLFNMINFLNESLQNKAFLHAALNHARDNKYSNLIIFLNLVASSEESPLKVALNLINPYGELKDIKYID